MIRRPPTSTLFPSPPLSGSAPGGGDRHDPADRRCAGSRPAVPLLAGGPAGADHARAAGGRGRHSRTDQAEPGPAGGVGRPPAAQRRRARRLHLGGTGVGPDEDGIMTIINNVITTVLAISRSVTGLAAR